MGMYYRTTSKDHKTYKYWAGKGIKICNEWLNDPLKFYLWSINNGYKEGLTIDRIDSNKDYEPDNCQWITKSENSKKGGHQEKHYITYKGKQYFINEIEKLFGIHGLTVKERLKRGWDIERAFNEPPKKCGKKYSKSYISK